MIHSDPSSPKTVHKPLSHDQLMALPKLYIRHTVQNYTWEECSGNPNVTYMIEHDMQKLMNQSFVADVDH